MLTYALIFFVIAVIAGMLGFKGVESGASKIAKIFFFIFIILALLVVGATVLGLKLAFQIVTRLLDTHTNYITYASCQRFPTKLSDNAG